MAKKAATDTVEPELTKAQQLCKLVNDTIGYRCTTTVDKIPHRKTRTSGIIALDLALGGGLPVRGIVEFWGDAKNYKSTLVLHTMAICQQAGGLIGRADVEQRDSHQASIFSRTGIDISNMATCNCASAEEYCTALATMIKANTDVVCLDSVGALNGLAWNDREQTEGDRVGGESKTMNRFVRIINSAFHPTDIENEATYPQTTLILISHAYSVIGAFGPGKKETTSGGRTKDYLALQQIKVRKAQEYTAQVDGKKTVVGVQIKFIINRNSIEFEKDGEFNLLFNQGEAGNRVLPDNFSTVWNYCCHEKMLGASGSGWLWRDAAATCGEGGQTVAIPGKEPTAKAFLKQNYRYCLRELFRLEQRKRPYFTPWEVSDVPDLIRVKDQEIPVGTDT